MAEVEEKVVMTPKCKTANSTTLVIERKAVEPEASDKIHVAGGDHTGIIINKEKNYGMFLIYIFIIFPSIFILTHFLNIGSSLKREHFVIKKNKTRYHSEYFFLIFLSKTHYF